MAAVSKLELAIQESLKLIENPRTTVGLFCSGWWSGTSLALLLCTWWHKQALLRYGPSPEQSVLATSALSASLCNNPITVKLQ